MIINIKEKTKITVRILKKNKIKSNKAKKNFNNNN
jgi:hypothetical protein